MKRLFDLMAALSGLVIIGPFLGVILLLVWLQDFRSPFYIAERIGFKGRPFKMVKVRSMVVNADKSGVDSTSADDKRITKLGRFIRRFKIDEFGQLWNVLLGQMSFVGPRPNVGREVDLYTDEEKRLLNTPPGITDLASIVFSDEGDILEGSEDPDLLYNQIIRPWKSRLGLVYIDKRALRMDIRIIFLTLIGVISRPRALAGVVRILSKNGVDEALIQVAKREQELRPFPPPGTDAVVASR